MPQEVILWMPDFLWKDNTLRGSQKSFHFFPGGPPPWHITPWMRANTGNFRYFEKWRDFEEKVERRGKGYPNVCNEHIDTPLSPWVPSIAHRVEFWVLKLKILKNDPYLNVIPCQHFPFRKTLKYGLFLRIFSFKTQRSTRWAMLGSQELRGASMG